MGGELHRVTPRIDPAARDGCCVARSRCDRLPAHMDRQYDTFLHAARDAEPERHTEPCKVSGLVE